MMKRILIPSLILCSFLIASVSTVVAADVFTDKTGDVIYYDTGEYATSSPNIDIDNIDIVEMTYSRQGITVTLTLKVNGNIENRGSINVDESEDNIDVVVYSLSLSTSNESYDIIYVNNECQITYGSTGEIENISKSDFSAEDSTLTVTFDLLSNDETYGDIYGETSYIKMSGDNYEYLDDTAPDVPDVVLDVTLDAPSEGKVGENIDFSGEALNGTPEYTWSWDFGDETTSTAQNPIHSYAEAGTYEVTLSVTDAEGNEGSSYPPLTITISDAEPSNGGDDGGEQESSNSGLVLFVVIIVAVVAVGIAVVVYIIRR
jgi:hypothetical protein